MCFHSIYSSRKQSTVTRTTRPRFPRPIPGLLLPTVGGYARIRSVQPLVDLIDMPTSPRANPSPPRLRPVRTGRAEGGGRGRCPPPPPPTAIFARPMPPTCSAGAPHAYSPPFMHVPRARAGHSARAGGCWAKPGWCCLAPVPPASSSAFVCKR
jgi:hypothetical protein